MSRGIGLSRPPVKCPAGAREPWSNRLAAPVNRGSHGHSVSHGQLSSDRQTGPPRGPEGGPARCCENAVAPGRRQPGWCAGPGTLASSPGGGVHTGTARREARETAHRGGRKGAGTAWNAGLRPASRGSAKPGPMTLRHANVSSPPSPNLEWRDCSPLRPTRGRAFSWPNTIQGGGRLTPGTWTQTGKRCSIRVSCPVT